MMHKVEEKMNMLTDHFDGSGLKARLIVGLFALGILVFLINNTVLFFVDEDAYFWPRLCMKAVTDTSWLIAAYFGSKYYPTRRNLLLIPGLVLYALGDIAVFFSIPAGGLLYGIGHLCLIFAIIETTYIRRWQEVVLAVSLAFAIIMLMLMVDGWALIIAGMVYGTITAAMMALSLSNRFYWLAGIVFIISDITGLARISLLDNKVTYVITTTIYFAAFFMLCISVFSTNRKEVVTRNDLLSMAAKAEKDEVEFWIGGKWAIGLINGDRKYSRKDIELIYDSDEEEKFLYWLKKNRYSREYGKRGDVSRYYSEKYGTLLIYPCEFDSSGTAFMRSESGNLLELDRGFFENVRFRGKIVPCIAPGGQRLIGTALKK